MTDDISRVLGQLEAKIDNLSEQQRSFRVEQRTDNKLIFERLDSISSEGCARGKRNSEAIRELQSRPERLVGIGAAIVAILAAVGSWFVWTMEKLIR